MISVKIAMAPGMMSCCGLKKQYLRKQDYTPPEIYIHSANPVGRQRINMALRAINSVLDSRQDAKFTAD